MSVTEVCRQAAAAATVVRELSTDVKNRLLIQIADAIDKNRAHLTTANSRDVEGARDAGISGALVDRLTLTDARVTGMVEAIRTIVGLPDPVGAVIGGVTRPNGLFIERIREPLGVVAVIYEARPNVAAEVTALCLKSGNSAVLRGSSVASHTNHAIVDVIAQVLSDFDGVPDDAVKLIGDTSRESALELLRAVEYVDLLVPRGGPGLIKTVRENATVPTVIDGDGNCHVYVDATADPEIATNIVINSKTSRPSVCNAAETLIVHEQLAESWLPRLLERLGELGVEIRGCERTLEVWPKAQPARESDWGSEYLDLVLAVRVVRDLEEALQHIHRWGTRNADAIVAQDLSTVRRFSRSVDSGSVFINASTRFSDGGEYGYGVEIGVSTQKLHVRGPMGLESLTCVKNVVWGNGQVRTR